MPATDVPGDLTGARVALVGINYAPESTGIGPYTSAMAHTWADAGAQVKVVTGVPHCPAWRVDPAYATGRRRHEHDGAVDLLRLRHHVPAHPGLVGRARMEGSFFRAAAPAVARTPSDVVVAVTPSISGLAAAVTAARGRPVGCVVQDLTGKGAQESGTAGGVVARAIEAGELALLRRCAVIGVVAPQFRVSLEAAGVEPGRIVDVGNFTHVHASTSGVAEAAARLGWAPGRFRVVHTGNMGMKQGLEHVVEAARRAEQQHLDVEFVLVGAGNTRPDIERAAVGLSTLRLVDPVDEDVYPEVLAAADVLLLHERPGIREMCLPSKLTSYTAAHRPILGAVDPGGISHAVLSGEGIAEVLPSGDADALVAAVRGLREDTARRADLADKAVAYGVSAYGEEAARERYVALLRALLPAAADPDHRPGRTTLVD